MGNTLYMNKEKMTYGYNAEQYHRFKKYALRYLILFSVLYCTIYCTRLNLQNAGAVLITRLGFSKADIGILTSTLFWSYGFGQLINGRLSDKIGPEKFVITSVIGSVISNLFITLNSSVFYMAVIWAINGFFQSMSWAPGIAIITRWWPSDKRGFATGFAYAFSGFGQALTTLIVTFSLSVDILDWKAIFIIPSICPVIILIVYIVFAKTSPEKVGLAKYLETESNIISECGKTISNSTEASPYRYLLTNPQYVAWMVIVFLDGVLRYGLTTWIPIYFIEKYDIDIMEGILCSLALPIGMGVGTLVVPWLTDKYCPNDRIRAVKLSSVVAGISIVLFSRMDPRISGQLVLIELFLFISGFCIYAISGTSGTYAADVGERIFAATATGIFSFAAYVGAGVQSIVYGLLLDNFGWNMIFISIAVISSAILIISIFASARNRRETGSLQI